MAPFYVMEVMKAAARREATGAAVLHLEVGQPSTPAPAAARAAAHAALDRDRLGYTDALGLPELRRAIAARYAERHDVDVAPERVMVTAGASGACVLAFLAAFEVGDRVAVAEPGYPCYRNMLTASGVEPVGVPVGPDTDFKLTPASLEAAGPLDGVVVGSPANPTGTVFDAGELEAVAAWCGRNGTRLVADEIYHGITYERPAPTAAPHTEHVVVNSFSKYFSMTGWRVGWLLAPDDLHDALERLAQNLYISPPTLAQHAALAALNCSPELDGHVARYAHNREVLLAGLGAAGIHRCAPPDGAFYLYADVSHLTADSQALCQTWLDELGVAVTSGIDFDPLRGHRFVRFSFCGATDEMVEAAARIRRWAAGRRPRPHVEAVGSRHMGHTGGLSSTVTSADATNPNRS